MDTTQAFDIIVAGGGMVGAAASCLLADMGLKIALVEAKEPQAYEPEQAMDLRVSAISVGSVEVLKACGIWQHLQGMRLCAYKQLQTWEHQHNKLSFHCDELNLPELGYIVENRLIQLSLWQKLQQHENVTLFCPSSLEQYQECSSDEFTGVLSQLSCGSKLSASMILACDGAHSKLRNLSHIGVSAWDYQQQCLLINIETDFPQQDCTWQEFCPTGPKAFLPLAGQNASLVWYHHADEIARLVSLDANKLKAEIEAHFPTLPGGFEIKNWAHFPLIRQHAHQYYKGSVVLLGDSAHSINPLAGQGGNLGFKDVQALVISIKKAISQGESWSNESVKQKYQALRKVDNHLMQSSMDLFYLGFSNDSKPLSWLRNSVLKLAHNSGPIKKLALRYALGLDVLPSPIS